MAGNRAFANAPNGDGSGDTVLVKSDLLPAEIVNYRTMGATPRWWRPAWRWGRLSPSG